MKDRFKPKLDRMRQANAIDQSSGERMDVYGFDKQFHAESLAVALEELMKHELFDPTMSDWPERTLAELRRGQNVGLARIKIAKLKASLWLCARDLSVGRDWSGPIQRQKRRPLSDRSSKWRANSAALEAMQANRPLKPPGR